MPAAATIGCQHQCPAYHGDQPHVGGPAIQGSPNVWVGGKNVLRAGDLLHCENSSPDALAQGSSTIFANGLPVGRIGDPSLHGGSLTEGNTQVFFG